MNFKLTETTDICAAVAKFQNHSCIPVIKYYVSIEEVFIFSCAEGNATLKEIDSLDNTKGGTFQNIPTNRLKETSDVCAPNLNNIQNNEIVNQ